MLWHATFAKLDDHPPMRKDIGVHSVRGWESMWEKVSQGPAPFNPTKMERNLNPHDKGGKVKACKYHRYFYFMQWKKRHSTKWKQKVHQSVKIAKLFFPLWRGCFPAGFHQSFLFQENATSFLPLWQQTLSVVFSPELCVCYWGLGQGFVASVSLCDFPNLWGEFPCLFIKMPPKKMLRFPFLLLPSLSPMATSSSSSGLGTGWEMLTISSASTSCLYAGFL